MYQTLLVPLDGSPMGEQALPMAATIARDAGARLYLVHVYNRYRPIYVEGLPVIGDDVRALHKKHARAYLEKMRERLPAEVQAQTRVALLDGSVPEAIATYAGAVGANLIVMTTHGYGGLARAWLGSVADSLVRDSSIPILLLRPVEDSPAREWAAPLKQILVPLDGSSLSEQILKHAEDLARAMGGRLALLHVVEPVAAGGVPPVVTVSEVSGAGIEQREQTMKDYLDGLARRLRTRGIEVETRVLVSSQPAAAILEDARRHGVDVIALATHGYSGLRRLLIGSVADKVLRGAETPILMFRPQPEEM